MMVTSEITRYSGMTRQQVGSFVEKVTNEIRESGRYDPLEIAATLKAMEDIVKGIRQGIQDMVINEAEKHPEKTFEHNGIGFTKTNRVSYDYSECSRWAELKEQIKEIESLMQTIKAPVADAETGELIPPARRKESQSVSINLKK